MTAIKRPFVGFVLAAVFTAIFPVSLHAQSGGTNVAMLAADDAASVLDVQSHLESQGLHVTVIDVGVDSTVATPTAAQLSAFDAVLTWSSLTNAYLDPAALGAALAAYVDAGGGVVQGAFSFEPTAEQSLAGPWQSDAYQVLAPLSFTMASSLTLGNILAGHPIVACVDTFDAGAFPLYHRTTVHPAAELVAQWRNGSPLAAARSLPNGGRIVALNFYPVSSTGPTGQFWRVETDGAALLANSLRYAADNATGPAVALVAADDKVNADEVACKLRNLDLFSDVAVIDAQSATPDLDTLLNYSAVLTWTNSSFFDASALGNTLAGFVDANRGVVHSPVSFADGARLDGRWLTDGYAPVIEMAHSTAEGLAADMSSADPIVFAGVSGVGGGIGGLHAVVIQAASAPAVKGTWSNGQILVAARKHASGGRTLSLNMYPPSSDAFGDSWDSTTDGARLIANTLLFAANHAPTVEIQGQLDVQATAAGADVSLHAAGVDLDGDALEYSWMGDTVGSNQDLNFHVPAPAPNQTSEHTLTVRVTDGKGGEVTQTVTVTVRAPAADTSKPGKVYGYGFVRADGMIHEVAFTALENEAGVERGGLLLHVKTDHNVRRGRTPRRNDRFFATTVESVTFAEGSTVLFAGTGKWNGASGYHYDVTASEHSATRRDDTVRITVTAPGGAIVAQVDGRLSGGNVTFVRVRR